MSRWKGASAAALAAMLCAVTPVAAADDAPKAGTAASKSAAPAVPPELTKFEAGLKKQTGDVRIPEARAVLHLGDRYYMLPAADAKRVLTEVWGNPPESVSDVLGLVIEKDGHVYDDSWGAVITYEATGHVSDADAAKQDYDEVLKSQQEATEGANEERKKAGYPAMHLVGWAQPPSYDPASHALIWARELRVDGDKANGLNYDVRLLGRTGVLSLNMIASMSKLPEVRKAAETFGKSAAFEQGAAYADFDPAAGDKSAEYGLAGLVAGGAALAVAKKIGFLAIILKFGKVILLALAAGGAAAWGFFKRLAGRREEDAI